MSLTDGNIIEIDNLSFKYARQNKYILKNLTLNIKDGQWIALIGHNGSGKSTLARLIDGLLKAESGSIKVDGYEMNEKNIWDIRKKIGMVFQNPDNQFVGADVESDIAFGLENQGERVVYVDRQNTEIAIQKIVDAKTPMVLQVTAAGNIIAGEPAIATIHVYPQQFIYKSGDLIYSSVIDGGFNAQGTMIQFLKQVNEHGRERGVIPDSLTGDIGTIPGDELFSAIRRVSTMQGKVHVEAIADGDTYASGPVHIKLRITQVPSVGILSNSN